MKTRLLITLLFTIALAGATQSSAHRPLQDQEVASGKLAPWVLDRTVNGQEAEFLVIMSDQADLSGADSLKTKKEKLGHLFSR